MAQAQPLPILYSFRRCPYAMRARLALKSAGHTVALREIVLRDKAPEFLKTSPKGTVPVLQHSDGTVLEESIDIMRWALGENDPENLLPEDVALHVEMDDLIARADGDFKGHLDRYKYSNRYDNAVAEEHREQGGKFLLELNARLGKGAFLLGDKQTMTDLAIAPFVRQFANTNRAWFDAQDWPHLRRWLETFLASERFTAVMGKYAKWKTGDAVTVF